MGHSNIGLLVLQLLSLYLSGCLLKEISRGLAEQAECSEGSYTCDNGICIGGDFVCDTEDDCGDNSDEKECSSNECGSGQFACGDGSCIPEYWVCDGAADCGSAADEGNCTAAKGQASCNGGQFMCDSEHCLPIGWRCDGAEDCDDGSDEKDCQEATCGADQFACGDNSCIPQRWLCDTDSDCPNGADEENCTFTCGVEEFTCADGKCIKQAWVCDNDQDCTDGSDEKNCTFGSTVPSAFTCGVEEFTCADGKCILQAWVCDNDRDCTDGSDERNCSTVPHVLTCRSDFVDCGEGTCIPRNWLCDNEEDCPGGTDERNCSLPVTSTPNVTTPHRCSADFFDCGVTRDGELSPRCLLPEWVCDGDMDCEDGRDEFNCSHETTPHVTDAPVTYTEQTTQHITSGVVECPVDYERYEGSCYRFVMGNDKNWAAGQRFCGLTPGAHLVSIDTLSEYNYITDTIDRLTRSSGMKWWWTSGSRQLGTDNFFWDNGGQEAPITLDKWRSGEPNNHGGNEDKLALFYGSDSRWGYVDMRGATHYLRFICEYDLGLAVSTTEAPLPSTVAPPRVRCPAGTFTCTHPDSFLRCIVPSWVCDGEADCQGGTDEDGCSDGKFVTSEKPIPQYTTTERQTVEPTAEPTSSQPRDVCLPDYFTHEGSCYRFVMYTDRNWEGAQGVCTKVPGGHLVSINSLREYTYIINTIDSLVPGSGMKWWWTSGSRQLGTDNFFWDNGDQETPITLDKWRSGEPNNQGGNEDKVALFYGNGRWGYVDMRGATHSLRYICEYELDEADCI